jgi:hypothetical protein
MVKRKAKRKAKERSSGRLHHHVHLSSVRDTLASLIPGIRHGNIYAVADEKEQFLSFSAALPSQIYRLIGCCHILSTPYPSVTEILCVPV